MSYIPKLSHPTRTLTLPNVKIQDAKSSLGQQTIFQCKKLSWHAKEEFHCNHRESNTNLHLPSLWKGGILTIGPWKLCQLQKNILCLLRHHRLIITHILLSTPQPRIHTCISSSALPPTANSRILNNTYVRCSIYF